jgi:hypothetical protein
MEGGAAKGLMDDELARMAARGLNFGGGLY